MAKLFEQWPLLDFNDLDREKKSAQAPRERRNSNSSAGTNNTAKGSEKDGCSTCSTQNIEMSS